MSITPVTPESAAGAEQIRAAAEQRYATVRSRGELAVPVIRKAIAAIYLDAKARMAAYQAEVTDDYAASVKRLTAAVWGIGDLATAGLDRVTASVSYRDAQDRAASLDNPSAARNLLARAEASGDELLARAVAHEAWQLGWADTLDAYLASRPRAAAALATLTGVTSARGKLSAADLFCFVMPIPTELAGMDEWAIASLAADPAVASVST